MSVYTKNGHKFKWGPEVARLNPEKAKLLADYATGKCLDVGCGSGIYSRYLYELGLPVSGVDSEPQFVKYTANKYPQINFLVADIYHLPFANHSFDTIILFDILEHVDDVKALKEALRVGKQVIISVPHQNQKLLNQYSLVHAHYLDQTHLRNYTTTSLTRLLKNAGLKILTCQPSLPISLSGLTIHSLSRGSRLRQLFFKLLLKPFLPEPPIYSTVFAVASQV